MFWRAPGLGTAENHYSAATPKSSSRNSSSRFGKNSAQLSVITKNTDSSAVTAARLSVCSCGKAINGAAAAAPRNPTRKWM